ncbi:MAG: hypothetical protein RL732_1289, partial [Bacteroidota bacterium]
MALKRSYALITLSVLVLLILVYLLRFQGMGWNPSEGSAGLSSKGSNDSIGPDKSSLTPPLDTIAYKKLNLRISNGDSSGRWPVNGPYPLGGAVFPFNRVVAYYGNLYSKQMGILGELPEQQMLDRLMGEVNKWQKADSSIKVVPALHYIAITAQGSPGQAGK